MEDDSVLTLELFFDLVFVFTVTQLTTALVDRPTATGVAQVTVIFGNLWWMFGGYVWLTNAVPPRRTGQRLLVLVAMAGYLLIAIAIPDAYDSGGVLLGVGYLVVSFVHSGLLVASSKGSTVRSMTRRGGSLNTVTAAFILVGGFADGTARWVIWALTLLAHWAIPFLSNPSGLGLRPRHFVERHGLILLIALGESIVATGAGVRERTITGALVVTALLGLTVAAALWWYFFDTDDVAAERALATAPEARQALLGLYAFGYGYLLVLPGIVLFAAGARLAVLADGRHRPADVATAWFLAAGVSLYVAGLAVIRAVLHSGPAGRRVVVAALAVATVAIGLIFTPNAQLGVAAVLLVAGLVLLDRGRLAGQRGASDSRP